MKLIEAIIINHNLEVIRKEYYQNSQGYEYVYLEYNQYTINYQGVALDVDLAVGFKKHYRDIMRHMREFHIRLGGS